VKTTINSARGVVTEYDGNGVVIEGPIRLSGEVLAQQSATLVTTTVATVTSPRTLVATTANCVLTLPNATSVDQLEYKIKKLSLDGYSLTIAATAGQTIDGLNSLVITAINTAVTLYAYNGAWYIF